MIETKVVEFRGCVAEFIIETWTEEKRINNLSNEKDILSDLIDEIYKDNENKVFYDIGANIGMYSILIADIVGARNVIAFEPHPSNVEHLRKNAKINYQTTMTILDYALSDSKDVTTLQQTSPEAGMGTHSLGEGLGEIEVNVDTGDNLIEEFSLKKPDIMKIDVEGAEYKVLKGLTNALKSCDTVYTEIHRDRIGYYDSSFTDILNLLDTYNFKTTKIRDRGAETFIKAVKTNDK